MPQPLPILMYHKIGFPPRDSTRRGLHVSPKAFDMQLKYLKESGYTFYDFNDLKKALAGEAPAPEKPVLLTFDDGHLDNYTHGLPILKKYKAKATIFVIAGDMGKTDIVWDDAGERAPANLMSWEQAREMRRAGVSIQSHGMTHRSFKHLPVEEITVELEESMRLIDVEIGVFPTAFAYPRGAFDPGFKKMARKAGYLFACTTEKGVNDYEHIEPLALRRVAVKGYRWIHDWKFKRGAMRGFI